MSESEAGSPRIDLRRDGRVAIVTICNAAARNALTRAMLEQGGEVFRALRRDETVGAVVLCGEGAHFSGGGNLNRMIEQRTKPRHTQAEHVDAANAWIMAMRECPQPVIAAVEGAAAGGGFSLALACDLFVASEVATLVMSHVKIGLSPDCGGTYWLMRALPHQAALELMLDAAPVPAVRLHQLGVVNKIAPKGEALNQAVTWAHKLAAGPPEVQGRIKGLAYSSLHRSLRDQLDAERDAVVESMYSDENVEGVNAFLEKRPPSFSAS